MPPVCRQTPRSAGVFAQKQPAPAHPVPPSGSSLTQVNGSPHLATQTWWTQACPVRQSLRFRHPRTRALTARVPCPSRGTDGSPHEASEHLPPWRAYPCHRDGVEACGLHDDASSGLIWTAAGRGGRARKRAPGERSGLGSETISCGLMASPPPPCPHISLYTPDDKLFPRGRSRPPWYRSGRVRTTRRSQSCFGTGRILRQECQCHRREYLPPSIASRCTRYRSRRSRLRTGRSRPGIPRLRCRIRRSSVQIRRTSFHRCRSWPDRWRDRRTHRCSTSRPRRRRCRTHRSGPGWTARPRRTHRHYNTAVRGIAGAHPVRRCRSHGRSCHTLRSGRGRSGSRRRSPRRSRFPPGRSRCRTRRSASCVLRSLHLPLQSVKPVLH